MPPTALQLKRASPKATIILIDCAPFPCPTAAAHGPNKIIRAKYEDPLCHKLALEALKIWNSDPIFTPWFHETGLVFASDAVRGNAIISNHRSLIGESSTVMLDLEEITSQFGGIFKDADWSAGNVNPGRAGQGTPWVPRVAKSI